MTTTAVPSKLPEDFALNIENLDKLINSDEATFANRFGADKMTVQGAIDTIKAFNNRAAWVALTAYAVKDLVLTGGTWYVCVVAHTSSAAFATDAASKWRIYQGALTSDIAAVSAALAASPGASLIGFDSSPGRTVKQQLDMLYYGIANVTDPKYGAADNGSDATAAIQAAIDACPVGGFVHGAGKTFTVTSLLLKSNMTLMNMNLVTKAGTANLVSPVTIDGRTTAKSNINVLNVKVDGNRANQTLITASAEDGGRHGFRLIGAMTDILIGECQANNCATDGIEIFSSTSLGATDAVFVFSRITLRNFTGSGNRRHGMSIDSMAESKLIGCKFNGNGLDLNATDIGTHGNRGARVGMLLSNPCYGNGIDLEGYGLGSSIENLHMHSIECRGNARAGCLFYDQSVLTASGFRRRGKIWISDCYFDEGVDASRDHAALAFTSTLAAEGTGYLYDGIYITNTRLDGKLMMRCVNRLRFEGATLYDGGADTYFSQLIWSDNIHLDASTTGGASRLVQAISSTYTVADGTLVFPGNPVLAKVSGAAGTLGTPVVTQVCRVDGRTFRFLIVATWTASASGVPVFSITPGVGSTLVAPPVINLYSDATALSLVTSYVMAIGNFRFTEPNTGALTLQITVDVKV